MSRMLQAQRYFEPGDISLAVLEGRHGDKPISEHSHDFIELVLFAQGHSIHEYAGKRYELTPGDVFIIHPGEPHAYVESKNVTLWNCIFLPEVVMPDLEYLKRMDGFFDMVMVEPFFRSEAGLRNKLHLDAPTRIRVEELLKTMRIELERKTPGFEAASRAMLIQLLVEVARFRSKLNSEAKQADSEELLGKRSLIRDCIRYIEEHYPEEIRLDNLADRAYLSPEYFSKVFKRLTSQTPIEFINNVRLEKAKQLLASSSLPVTDIAYRTGFHDSNYFSRQFKKTTGFTPGDYRKRAAAGYL
jgi:AraC-like DNA-binding protein